MSLAHNGNSQLADSNTGETQGYSYNDGLSPEGREVIAEMNRLGIMVDLSHPAKGANLEAIRLSKAPVIASHTSVRALADVSRNMDDEQLLAVMKNGGVVQINGVAAFLKTDSKDRTLALTKLRSDFGLTAAPTGPGGAGVLGRAGGLRVAGASPDGEPPVRPCPIEGAATTLPRPAEQAPADRAAQHPDSTLSPRKNAQSTTKPSPRSTPNTARRPRQRQGPRQPYRLRRQAHRHRSRRHLVRLRRRGGIDGWNSAAEAFNVTLELVRRGYTEAQIGKLWSGNLLRVWAEVDKTAQKLQKSHI